jgi:hypothetical protein
MHEQKSQSQEQTQSVKQAISIMQKHNDKTDFKAEPEINQDRYPLYSSDKISM